MVTLYSDGNYTGASQTVGVGVYNAGKLSVGVKATSSLKVPAGKRASMRAPPRTARAARPCWPISCSGTTR